MKYTTYLFDFDYTLADSSRGIVICFRNVLERHGHTGISDEAIKRTIGKTLEDSFSILSGITTPETLAEYKKEYVKEADTYMTVNTFFFPETVTLGETEGEIDFHKVRIYDRDRTICDVLRNMNKMDKEVFNKAVQGYVKDPKKNIPNLIEYAKVLRVQTRVKELIGVWL